VASGRPGSAHLLGDVVDVRLEEGVVEIGHLRLFPHRLIVQLGQRPVRIERAATHEVCVGVDSQ